MGRVVQRTLCTDGVGFRLGMEVVMNTQTLKEALKPAAELQAIKSVLERLADEGRTLGPEEIRILVIRLEALDESLAQMVKLLLGRQQGGARRDH